MTEIVLASNNKKKIAELKTLLTNVNVKSLRDIDFTDEIVEDGDTFEENSLIKASVPARLGYIGIADDSGLSVDSLGGAPGIYSARYSGEGATDESNRKKLLSELDGVPTEKRGAHFVCTVSVVLPEKCGISIPEEWRISDELSEKSGIARERAMIVRGECFGRILTSEVGDGGFGYDSLFMYYEFNKTFAQLSGEEKNSVSHRGRAMREFISRLNVILGQ